MLTTQFFKQSAATLLGLGLVTYPAQATVLVNTTADANALANSISAANSGITITSSTYNGAPVASGTFSGGSSAGISINTGIILTSGTAALAAGPNNSDSVGTNNSTLGDPQLNALIGNAQTADAASLTINFTTTEGNLFFNYVFASEEYNEYVSTGVTGFNDVFGFFLDGTNIALIPGTNTPVSIYNVNGGKPFSPSPTNPLAINPVNPQFYNNNDLDDPGPPSYNIQYDGFTDVFQAQALNLTPGAHTIKLAIADTSDGILDSAVFIQGGSFGDTPVAPPVASPGVPPVAPTDIPFEFSPGLGLLLLGACATMSQLKSKVQQWKFSVSASKK